MLDRLIRPRLAASKKSLLLLGPRQVGKSTLCRTLRPDLVIDLADEESFLRHAKDPGLLRRILLARTRMKFIMLDEVQRLPALLNVAQALLDERPGLRFLLTGSSAGKLKRGRANLLPGRIIQETLGPLSFLEIGKTMDLERALQVGMLPGIYLDPEEGEAVLGTYAQIYLRQEIMAEGLARNLGGFARFLDRAALSSGLWINYSKVASDVELPKESVRRFFDVLEDTLLIIRLPPFKPGRRTNRRITQRDRYVFFDVGVRNALLGIHRRPPSPEERGRLFEQWLVSQVVILSQSLGKDWALSSYRTEGGAEVDLVIESEREILGLEIKSGKRTGPGETIGLRSLSEMVPAGRRYRGIVAYAGAEIQDLGSGYRAYPYRDLLQELAETR